MNRIARLLIIALIGILILTVGIWVYSDINSSKQPVERINVTINSFNLTGYFNPVGVVWDDKFNLTYINNAAADVYNATITFSTNSTYKMNRTIIHFASAPQDYGEFMMGTEYPLGTIKANEIKEFSGCIVNNLGDTSKVHGFAFTATLKSNETVLDQETIMIPPLV